MNVTQKQILQRVLDKDQGHWVMVGHKREWQAGAKLVEAGILKVVAVRHRDSDGAVCGHLLQFNI